MDSRTTVFSLFNGLVQFVVPEYQRAYSWHVKQNNEQDCQVNQFLDDIKEQHKDKKYFLGHFLFETIENDRKYAVIDGQQRLTTIIIFMSSLYHICKKRGIERLDEYSLHLISDTYLEYEGLKFVTVHEDLHYFMERVLKGNADAPLESKRKSELNIKHAADFFDSQLSQVNDHLLAQWFKIINTAEITTYSLSGEDAKLAATQIFSLQNDRGKKLTTLEKLKAYLMYHIYKCSSESISVDIDLINSCFSDIYAKTEEIDTHEDTVLRWHCEAFLSHYDSPLASIKTTLSDCPEQEKRKWILDFIANLKVTFRKMVDIEHAEHRYSSYIADICYLDRNNVMPLLIKLAHYNKLVLDGYTDEALKYIENILFKLTFTMGNYKTNSFVSIAKGYKQDGYKKLISDLKYYSENGFQWYWDFTGDCKRYFETNNYHYNSDLRYVLYKYENYLRCGHGDKLLPIEECSNILYETSVQNTLDHITPVNPRFTEYSDDFKSRFLFNIGNLSLLSLSKNSSKNNNDPVLEKEKYNGVYWSQKEIYETLNSAGKWGAREIADRRMKLLRFIFQNWELGNPSDIQELAPSMEQQ